MKNWELKEDNDAKSIKGRKNRGSGNRWYNPGDSRSDNFLVESKFTEGKSYSLNRSRIQKICNEALLVFKIPLFMVQIQDLEVVVMMKEDWEKMVNQPK